jgi:hypothetical protein
VFSFDYHSFCLINSSLYFFVKQGPIKYIFVTCPCMSCSWNWHLFLLLIIPFDSCPTVLSLNSNLSFMIGTENVCTQLYSYVFGTMDTDLILFEFVGISIHR